MHRGTLLSLALVALLALPSPRGVRADESPSVKQGVDDIQEDINKAIDRGVLWLLEQQQTDGSWGQDSLRYPTGMTGLALYTLLKSGVPAEHPCVALGFRSLLSVDPHETYVIACQLLALGATGNPAYHVRMERLAKRLASLAVRGSWSYPLAHEGPGWADRPGNLDLSNAQFAVLGLHAAQRVGASVPGRLISDVIRQTRFHQQLPKNLGGVHPDGTPREAAGFAYHGPGQSGLGAATGSMTCAGITVLEICRRMLGSAITARQRRQIDDAILRAVTWLGEAWSVDENPGQEQGHKLYYLYGLERVGSLLDLTLIDGHAWYAEGARALLATQKKDGAWGSASDTAFALLFLLRATRGEITGEGRARSAFPTYATPEDSPLRLRTEGHSPMRAWITSVRPDLVTRHGDRGHVRLTRVEYLVGEQVEVTVAQGDSPHGADETHRAVLHFPRAGKYTVRARAHVDGPNGQAVIESTPLEVDVKLLVQPWAWHEAAWMARDLRVLDQIEARATSHNNDHQGPEKTVDRHTEGYWVCMPKPADPRPTLSLALRRAVRANTIVLAPVPRRDSGRSRFDRPKRFEVVVNGKGKPIVVAPEEDELRSTVVRLPRPLRIKALDVAIAARTPGQTWPGESGFREVTLELVAVDSPTCVRGADGTCSLACETAGAEIRYTLDGSVPTRDSPRYDGPFRWPGRTRLHASAMLPSGETSRLLIAVLD
jgi:hypothetical protein